MSYHEWNKFEFVKINTDLAYLLGVYLGDGYVYKKAGAYKLCLATKDKDFAEEFSNIVERILNKKPNMVEDKTLFNKTGQAIIWRASIGSNSLCNWLKEVTKEKTIIPDIVCQDKEIAKIFFQGVMDSEGWIAIISEKWRNIAVSGTEQWFLDLEKVMNKIGLKYNPRKAYFRKSRGYNEYVYNLNHKSYLKVGLSFSIKRKRDRLVA